MGIFQAFAAPFSGIKIVLTDAKVRHLAVKPWLIGVFVYLVVAAGFFYFFPTIQAKVVSSIGSGCGSICEAFVIFALAISLFLAACALTIAFTLVLSGVYQIEIAKHVLEKGDSTANSVQEIVRSVVVELLKLVIVVPVLIIAALIGLIPIFLPVAFLLGAWVLGWQYLDLSMDANGEAMGRRLTFPLRRPLVTAAFGAPLALAGIIPFLLVFLAPAAAAGGAYLLKKGK